MKPLNVVAESLKSLGVDSRAVAQATGISETNLTAAPSKKCANAPTLGALFAESPDPVTLFERMLKEGTPGFSTDEKLTTSLHGLTAALKLAENAEDPQARLAVIVRAVQLAERAGVSKTRQEAAQAFAAWIAGVYLRGIPGGSTKMEVELRVELARAIEQRDDLSKMLADAEVGHAAELEDAAKRAMLSSDSLHNARMAEIRGIAAILGATEEESLEDAARRAVREREEAERKCSERLPAVPTEAQILEGIQKLLKSHKVAPIPVLPFDAEVTFVPPKTPAIDYLRAESRGDLPVSKFRDIGIAIKYLLGSEPIDGIDRETRRRIEEVRRQLKAMAAAQALCKPDQEPAERIAELDVWLRDAERREKELRAHNDGCHAEIARAQSEITRLSEAMMAEKRAREAAKEFRNKLQNPHTFIGEIRSIVDAAENENVTDAIRRAINSANAGTAEWVKLRAQVGMVLGRGSQEGIVDAARRVMGALNAADQEAKQEKNRADAAAMLIQDISQKLERRPDETLADAAQRVMSEPTSFKKELSAVVADLDKLRSQMNFERQVSEGRREQVMEVQAERDSLRTEVTMLSEELKTQKDEREEDQKELAELAANLDTQRTEVRKLQAVLALCRNERDLVAKELRADKEAFARDATRVRLALESEVKDLKDRLGAATAELAIIAREYDEALELCDRDGMTPTEQIKELRKELEDIRPEAEQMAGWRQSSLNRQVEIQNLQAALAEEKKQRQDFVAALCAELGVQGGERTAMAAVEQLKENHKRLGERMASTKSCDANCEPCEPPTRPADSSCTCFDMAPCAHCTWYSDRGIDEPDGTPDSSKPDAADGGLVMAD